MGLSTVNQLIQRAKNLNSYNNSGVSSDVVWVDFFNEALMNMVEELEILQTFTITYDANATSYTLPDDYYAILSLTNESNLPIEPFREVAFTIDGGSLQYPGYEIKNHGANYVMELNSVEFTTLTLTYIRYPAQLIYSDIKTQKPEIPTVGETALCYKAITHALENNNQPGQAQYYEEKYQREVQRIDWSSVRAKGG